MINPKYEYLREYVERIPKDFETIGTVIHSGRNLIKMITVDGLDINVKRYTIPPLINRIAYAFFRPSKGKRAFVYPEKLSSGQLLMNIFQIHLSNHPLTFQLENGIIL